MKPLISFFILSYNQEKFISDAVSGAFSQDYSPLEIILSDDCSSDDSFAKIKQMVSSYKGPHAIILNHNQKNLGIGGHINRIMELAHGELIVAGAGDDVSVPERVTEIYRAYESSNRSAKSIYSNYIVTDVHRNVDRLGYDRPPKSYGYTPNIIVRHNYILMGCSHAWSRDVFSLFGPLITPLTCEDMAIPLRSSLIGHIEYIHKPLVFYRQHGTSVWNYKWHDKKRIDVSREIEFDKFWMHERMAIYKNWDKDIQIMLNISPSRERELKELQHVVHERMSDMKNNITMLQGNFLKNLKIILKKLTDKGYRHNSIRHQIGLFLFPRIYKYYKTYKNKYILR